LDKKKSSTRVSFDSHTTFMAKTIQVGFVCFTVCVLSNICALAPCKGRSRHNAPKTMQTLVHARLPNDPMSLRELSRALAGVDVRTATHGNVNEALRHTALHRAAATYIADGHSLHSRFCDVVLAPVDGAVLYDVSSNTTVTAFPAPVIGRDIFQPGFTGSGRFLVAALDQATRIQLVETAHAARSAGV
jgi:hypothetical protein